MKRFHGKCPICNEDMYIAEYKCDECGVSLAGHFEASPFSKLDPVQLKFIEIFVKNQGNIKSVEKELDISYPTVKKHLDKIVSLLFEYSDISENTFDSKESEQYKESKKSREYETKADVEIKSSSKGHYAGRLKIVGKEEADE